MEEHLNTLSMIYIVTGSLSCLASLVIIINFLSKDHLQHLASKIAYMRAVCDFGFGLSMIVWNIGGIVVYRLAYHHVLCYL